MNWDEIFKLACDIEEDAPLLERLIDTGTPFRILDAWAESYSDRQDVVLKIMSEEGQTSHIILDATGRGRLLANVKALREYNPRVRLVRRRDKRIDIVPAASS
jgi:hypothetical protein